MSAGIALQIKCGIHIIYILLIQFLTQKLHCLSKALEVDNFPFPQELDYIVHIRIVTQTQNIIISHTRLLLRSQVLSQVSIVVTMVFAKLTALLLTTLLHIAVVCLQPHL